MFEGEKSRVTQEMAIGTGDEDVGNRRDMMSGGARVKSGTVGVNGSRTGGRRV